MTRTRGVAAVRPEPLLAGLRVLGFCDYFSPASCGGTERVASEVYDRLTRWGARVTVVTTLPPTLTPPASGAAGGVNVAVIAGRELSGLIRAQLLLSPALLRRAEEVLEAERPHVVHANSLHFQSSFVAAVLARRHAVPLVTTAHLGDLRSLAPGLRLASSCYERTAGRMILGRSARVIAVAEAVARHLVELGVPRARIDVVPNGVDHDRFFAPNPEPPGNRAPRVVFVGRLVPNKGPQLLLEALGELRRRGRPVETDILGDGPLRARLERRARALGLDGQVHFAGRVDDVAERLRRADVLVRPSATEGMPLAVLEAMASGVCVVASDVAGNAELVRHRANGVLFPTGDVGALVETLDEVLADPGLRRRLCTEGRVTALAHSWEQTASRTGRVLAEAGARRNPGPRTAGRPTAGAGA